MGMNNNNKNSAHKLQTKAHRLGGMWDIFVIGSILSGQPMLTYK